MKIAICGLGVMGKNHLRVSKKLGFEITSTYDPLEDNDYDFFIKTLVNCDSLVISNPTKYHTKTILDAKNINKNLKILCEKPICENTEDPFLGELEKYESSIVVGQIERFNPVVQKLIQTISTKNIEIIQVKTKRINNVPSREKIDCKKDIGIHDIDFSCFLCKDIPEKIQTLSTENKHHETMVYKINKTHVINEISWLYPYKERTFEILTTDGVFLGNFYKQELKFIDWSGEQIEIPVEKIEPLINEHMHLKKMVTDNEKPIVSISQNIKLLKLMGY
jgi:UDP-N-acetylglucosamine 3-dehydrogenase